MLKTKPPFLPGFLDTEEAAPRVPALALSGLCTIGRPAAVAGRAAPGRFFLAGLLAIGPGPDDTIH